MKHQINERYIMKTKDKLLQKQNDTLILFKEIVRNYVALENRLKALEGKADKKSS